MTCNHIVMSTCIAKHMECHTVQKSIPDELQHAGFGTLVDSRPGGLA